MVSQSTSAEALFHENRKLAYGIAVKFRRKYFTIGLDTDDVHQHALLGLWQACVSFDPDRGWQFSTFAWHTITNQLLRPIIEANAMKRGQMPNLTSICDDDNHQMILDRIPARDDEQAVRRVDDRDQVEHLLRHVHGRQREVLVNVFGLFGRRPRNCRDLAPDYGVGKAAIDLTKQKALAKVRRTAGMMT